MPKELFKIANKGNDIFVSSKVKLDSKITLELSENPIKKCNQNYITCNIPYCYICAAPYSIDKLNEFMWNGNIITTRDN